MLLGPSRRKHTSIKLCAQLPGRSRFYVLQLPHKLGSPVRTTTAWCLPGAGCISCGPPVARQRPLARERWPTPALRTSPAVACTKSRCHHQLAEEVAWRWRSFALEEEQWMGQARFVAGQAIHMHWHEWIPAKLMASTQAHACEKAVCMPLYASELASWLGFLFDFGDLVDTDHARR